ncbi:MAG TPA: hypothetical protein VIW24_26975 [Aldersonia sp.]
MQADDPFGCEVAAASFTIGVDEALPVIGALVRTETARLAVEEGGPLGS